MRLAAILLALGVAASSALAQGISLGGLRQDPTLPVEITAEALEVSQGDGTATFAGNVIVAQGEMRLSADRIRVVYGQGRVGEIRELVATGGVTLDTGTEAAEAEEATYSVESGIVEMRGEVLLTQGQSALSGDRLVIDLTAGTGAMEGRVRTVFRPGAP